MSLKSLVADRQAVWDVLYPGAEIVLDGDKLYWQFGKERSPALVVDDDASLYWVFVVLEQSLVHTAVERFLNEKT